MNDQEKTVSINRRQLLKRGIGLGMIATHVAGVKMLVTSRSAYAKSLSLETLNKTEAQILEDFAEALVPGAREAGIAHYLDYNLGAPPMQTTLIAGYFNLAPPYLPFYRSGIEGLASLSLKLTNKEFVHLSEEEKTELISTMFQHMSGANLPGWKGESSPFLFYQCVRSDALDIVYGTPEGFQTLGVPYMEHILPPGTW
jgi:hypothetical protein